MIKVITAYTQKYKLNYNNNAEDYLFISRKHQVISLISWGRILSEAAEAVGINKNIGAESIRKTYGINIYEHTEDKLNALLFLGELWGHMREAQIIRYLNLSADEIDFNYYFGEKYALGKVNLSKIRCLREEDLPKTEEIKNTKKDPKKDKITKAPKKDTAKLLWEFYLLNSLQ